MPGSEGSYRVTEDDILSNAQRIGHGVYIAAPSGAVRRPVVFPAPEDFAGQTPQNNALLFSRAPWAHSVYVKDLDLLWRYQVQRMLPGQLPFDGVGRYSWLLYGAVSHDFIRRHRSETLEQAITDFTRLTYSRLRRTPSLIIVPDNVDVDLMYYRRDADVGYVDALLQCRPGQRWESSPLDVGRTALFMDVTLPAEFRYVKRAQFSYFQRHMKWERETRKRFNVLVPYQNVEIDRIKAEHISRLYVTPHPEWPRFEVCDGFAAELPPVLSYHGHHLIHDRERSHFWRVFFTEWVVQVAVHWLWECYDTYRMWHLPPSIVERFSTLPLSRALGSVRNEQDLYDLLDMYSRVNWGNPNEVPLEQNRRKGKDNYPYCLGRRHSRCGDFVFIDPWSKEFLSPEMARARCQTRREIPCGHPIGLVYQVNQATREPSDDGDANMAEGEDDVTAIVKGKNASSSRIKTCPPSPAGSVVVVAPPAELHPAIIALLKDVGLSTQHTHQDRDSLVRFLKYRLDDAEVALDAGVKYHANLKLLADVGIVPRKGEEAVDPLALLKRHIDEVKAKATFPLTETGCRGRRRVYKLPGSNLLGIVKPSPEAKSPASSSVGTALAVHGKGKAPTLTGLRSTPAPASRAPRATGDDGNSTAEVVHEEVMAEGHAHTFSRVPSQRQSQSG